MAGEKHHRYLIKVYTPVIKECLIPSQLFSYMAFFRKDMSDVAKLERSCGIEAATELFLQKLLASEEPGWFQAFVTALDNAGFSYLSSLLMETHVKKDSNILRELFHLYLPLLKDIVPSNVILSLTSSGCLSKDDESEILAVEQQKGAQQGAIVLLDHVARKDADWFAKLMHCLTLNGLSYMVEEILSPEAAQAVDLATMKQQIQKLADFNEKPLFKAACMERPWDQREEEFQLSFQSTGDSGDGNLRSHVPVEGRQSPEGSAACAEADLIPREEPPAENTGPLRLDNTPPVLRRANVHAPITGEMLSLALNNLSVSEEEEGPRSRISGCSMENNVNSHDIEAALPRACSDMAQKILNNAMEHVQAKDLHLRAYQTELAQPAMDGKNVIVSAPTGSGKTHVALKITQHHFETADPEQEPKVVFIVPTVALVDQQWKMFKTYLNVQKSIGICGDQQQTVPFLQLIRHYEIIILTPQILVDALKDKTIPSLSMFSLLLFDECHHAMKTHPYARIQAHYLKCKLNTSRPSNLPQIVGLTASVGVGKKSSTVEKAINHILKLCANLDAQVLGSVEANRKELERHVNRPNEEKQEVQNRAQDPFYESVSDIMNRIEQKMKKAPELRDIPDDTTRKHLMSPPSERGGERYTEWLGKMRSPVECIEDQYIRRLFYSCTLHLNMYNSALILNADCRTGDALEYIAKNIGVLDTRTADETDVWLNEIFNDEEDYLGKVSEDPKYANPKLEVVKEIVLAAAKKNPDLRCIIFVRTREMTVALANWMNEDEQLKPLGADRLAGKGPSAARAGMNQAQQDDILKYFQNGHYKVIVATTVAEEGLDIQKCNLVIRYEHVTNEIAYVQARGRGRAEGAQYIVIGGTGTGTIEKEQVNLMREQTMELAIRRIKVMDRKEFADRVLEYQKEILMEWTRLERELRRKGQRSRTAREEACVLRCKKCDHFVCLSTDVRKIQDSHHVVIDLNLLKIVRIQSYPNPDKHNDFDNIGQLFCNKCNKDWGIQGLHKGAKFQILRISAFVVVNPDLSRETFRKWKDVRFGVSALTNDELQAYDQNLNDAELNDSDSD